MSRNRPGPAGPTIDHDHSGAGQGGGSLDPDAINLTGDEPFDFGDVQIEFRPGVGTGGALVFRDTATGEDRFFIEVGDVARFANQAVRMPDGLKMLLGTDEDYSMAFDAAVGASGAVVFRDEANNQDRLEIRVGDVFRLLAQNLDVTGNDIDNIGGTPAANAGALRLANATALNWRSSEDDGDFGWRLDAAENMIYAAAGTDRAQFAENGNLSIEGTLSEGVSL